MNQINEVDFFRKMMNFFGKSSDKDQSKTQQTPAVIEPDSPETQPVTATSGVSMKDWEAAGGSSNQPSLPANMADTSKNKDSDGRIVTRNRQIAYMQPINPEKNLNVSLGLGKPQMRNLHGKGQSAILTVGGNPGDRKNFAGVQLSQPITGANKGPGISAVFRKRF